MSLDFPDAEKKILKFWEEKDIFNKLRDKNKAGKPWSFLDGPITANNPMGVHHAWGRTYKDLFQRFFAMKGRSQRYQNGFDCQGLWVEVEVEKELGFKNKKDIEAYGVDKFVEKCKERVNKYSAIQTQQSKRLGQWMDWENSYFTMSDENNYAIWGFLKKCWQDGNLYKGRDSVPWCPRCGTAISQHEILTEEYKEITHKAVYLKLSILDGKFKGASFLVWTTTPWTIPANVALAVNPELEYGIFGNKDSKIILLDNLAEKILSEDFVLEKKFLGKELKGLSYEAPFDNLPRVLDARKENPKTFHTVVLDKDFVTALEGTGIVHIAPGAGEEDFKLGKKENLPVVDVIDESAVYLGGMAEFSGKNAKKSPELIFDYLSNYKTGQFLFKLEDYTHRYPTCWRCKAELVWRVVDEWYILMDKLRKPLMDATKKINWIPDFGKERELDWLKNMHDWLISKKRYWGLTLPIFECECGNFEVIGSKEELKERAVQGWQDFEGKSPHKPWVDKVKIKCSKCGEIASRIPDVGNPWLDAGIVPFSTTKYNTDKKYWKKWFPIELVCESFPGQFKNWFYSIIVMSVVLEKCAPVKNIFGYASVKDEKGEEMHKSKGNAIWFDEAVEKIGADPMRWMYAKQNPADNLKFGYLGAEEVRGRLLTMYNALVFFTTYVKKEEFPEDLKVSSDNILDKWIISKFNSLLEKVEDNFENFNPASGVVAIEDFFITDLSLWYVRRSRKRFHQAGEDRNQAIKTFYYLLLNITKIIAPIMPFFAEEMYQTLRSSDAPESVHLADWPSPEKKKINKDLETGMDKLRSLVNLVLAQRTALGIKVRQPLSKLTVKSNELGKEIELLEILKEEVNVREISFNSKLEKDIELDTELTDDLKKEGERREFIRTVRSLRKDLGLAPGFVVTGIDSTATVAFSDKELLEEIGTRSLNQVASEADVSGDVKKTYRFDGKDYHIGIKK